MPGEKHLASGWLLPAVLVWGGCAVPPGGFDSPDPAARMEASTRAAREGDESAVPKLINQLSSDDPAERLVAILALEKLTGDRRGYDFAAPEEDRERAVQGWVEWWRGGMRGGEGERTDEQPAAKAAPAEQEKRL